MGVDTVVDQSSPRTTLPLDLDQLHQQKMEQQPQQEKKVCTEMDSGNAKSKQEKGEGDEAEFLRFMVADFHGIARCKVVTKSAFPYMKKRGPGMAWKTVLLSFDEYFNCDAKRLDGVRCTDARLTPAEDTVPRALPWAGQGHSVAGVMCETFWGIDGMRQEACPRYMARRLCDQLEAEHNLRLLHASEMEFVMFNEDGSPLFAEGSLYIPQAFAFLEKELLQLSTYCEKAGVPIETLQTEFGPGQIEVVLKPVFGVEGADNEFIFKSAAKEILQKEGQHGRATFMSKPIFDKVGSSNHYNHSLWHVKEDGETEDAMWSDSGTGHLSETAQHWLAGVLKHAPAIAAIASPTVNCWRRLHLDGGTRAIGTPSAITWGVEHRLAMIRVIARGKGKATYLENRMAGSAMNPYLALAAHVAAGMDGIKNKIPLPKEGAEENEFGLLPASLEDALQALENDEAMKEHLGQEFINWFADCKRKEMDVVAQHTERCHGDSFRAEKEFYQKWI